jgi:hypothetical protein
MADGESLEKINSNHASLRELGELKQKIIK